MTKIMHDVSYQNDRLIIDFVPVSVPWRTNNSSGNICAKRLDCRRICFISDTLLYHNEVAMYRLLCSIARQELFEWAISHRIAFRPKGISLHTKYEFYANKFWLAVGWVAMCLSDLQSHHSHQVPTIWIFNRAATRRPFTIQRPMNRSLCQPFF